MVRAKPFPRRWVRVVETQGQPVRPGLVKTSAGELAQLAHPGVRCVDDGTAACPLCGTLLVREVGS